MVVGFEPDLELTRLVWPDNTDVAVVNIILVHVATHHQRHTGVVVRVIKGVGDIWE
jgi:hypothetical protein